MLGTGKYANARGPTEPAEQLSAATVLERLRCLGQLSLAVASLTKKDDCLYDLAKATGRPLRLYHVLLRWLLREQDDPNLGTTWNKICPPLTTLLSSLMSKEHDDVSEYLRRAAHLAETGKLRGSSFRRTAQAEPFTAFIQAVRSRKSHMDWDAVFAALTQQYHTRLDRIREHGVGKTKYEQIEAYYAILKQFFAEVYNNRPDRLLADRKTLEAAYLFFLQEARAQLKQAEAAEDTAAQ